MARDAKWYANWIRLLPASSADEKMRNLEAADLMEELDKQVPRWISVEERLPEGEDPVLILVKETEHYGLYKEKSKVYYCQYLAYWDDAEWYTTWCNGCRKITDTANEPNADDYEVTHWMPLPEAPKEPIRTTRATKENHDEGKAV